MTRLRGRLLAGTTLALAVAASALTAVPASADDDFLTVQVRKADGITVASGAEVTLVYEDGGEWNELDSLFTDTGGYAVFTIDDSIEVFPLAELDDGVHGAAFGGGGLHLDDADGFTAPASIVITLPVGATLSGTVTDPDGVGLTSPDVTVRASFPELPFLRTMQVAPLSDGNWVLEGVPATPVRLQFAAHGGTLVGEWWEGAFVRADATLLDAPSGSETTGLDAQLDWAASVAGTVTSAATGDPLAGQYLYAEQYSEQSADWVVVANAYTHDNGNYVLNGVPPGETLIRFMGGSGYASEYYDGAAGIASAERLTLTAETPTIGIDADLESAGGAAVVGGDVTILGTPTVGETLTAELSGWEPDVEFEYVWLADGAQLPGDGTSPTLVLGPSLAGTDIDLTIIGRRIGSTLATESAPTVGPVAEAVILPSPKPEIKGKAKVGRTLRAKTGTWMAGASISYKWYAGSQKIGGANERTWTVRKKFTGDKIQVKVTAVANGYVDKTRPSKKTSKVKAR